MYQRMIIDEAACRIAVVLRGILAHKLNEYGLSQYKISQVLNVSQPMVNKLLRKPLEEYYAELERMGVSKEVVEHYVDVLHSLALRAPRDRFEMVSYQVINTLALQVACIKHSDVFTSCLSQLNHPVDPSLEYYRIALARITSIKGLRELIPEVGSNLVYAPRPPAGISEVIGLTGRIVKTLEGVVALGEPMYGGSRHLSRILCLVSRFNPDKKVGFIVSYKPSRVEKLREIGLKLVLTGPHRDHQDFWASIERVVEARPDVIVDLGGEGLEPVVYVFTESFDKLENILLGIIGDTRG